MVKHFTLQWRFAEVTPREFFNRFFANASYIATLHTEYGDSGVDVSDWIGSDTEAQRIVFYSKNDGGTATRCIETQRYQLHPDGGFALKVHVNPENPLGGTAFAIKASWNARGAGESGGGTEIDITVTLECKKRLWGGYGNSMVEGLLEKSARAEYDLWLSAARKAVAVAQPVSPPPAPPPPRDDVRLDLLGSGGAGGGDEPATVAAPSMFNRHALRYRVSTVGHGLVRGTERFVQVRVRAFACAWLFDNDAQALSGTRNDDDEDDDDNREEREALITVPIDTSKHRSYLNSVNVFYHRGQVVTPRSCCQRRRRTFTVLLVVVVLLALAAWGLYHFEKVPALVLSAPGGGQ